MSTTKELVPAKVKTILDLENHLVVKNGVIEQTPELLNFLIVAKQLESQIKASYKLLEAEMLKHHVKTFKGDWGYVSIAERLNWKAIDKVAPRFYKKSLDTSKLKAYFIAMDKLPNGIDVSTTRYISPHVK